MTRNAARKREEKRRGGGRKRERKMVKPVAGYCAVTQTKTT